jgi:hypothetical protein
MRVAEGANNVTETPRMVGVCVVFDGVSVVCWGRKF